MIGKPLRERYDLGALPNDRAVALAHEALATHARPLVEVRARGAEMIACLVVRADKPARTLCRQLGLDVKPGASAVFGLSGSDAARLFERLAAHQKAWLEIPCGPRETKLLLLAGGIALVSLETTEGAVNVSVLP